MMAGMITLLLTGLLRGGGPSAAWCSKTSRCGPLRPAVLGPAVPPVERLGGRRLPRPTRHRDPVAPDRLQARLDLEELPKRARPPGRRPGGPSAHPPDVHGQPTLGRAADSRGAPETGRRDLTGGGLQVRRPPSEAAIAELANRSPQRC